MPAMRPWIGVGLTAFVCLCPCRAPAAPSAETLFKDWKVNDMQLSPSGRYVSSIMALNGGMNLVIIDLMDNTKSALTALRRERSDAELASWEKLLGGHRDGAFLKEQSPLYNADKIRGPVFLAYSVDDTQVPYSDAEDLKKALERGHKSVVLLGKNQEPHLFDKEADKIDLFTKLEPFLQGCNPPQ
jgi:fermentation-respiration switch protein FrsA (DUF1100 family)